MDVESRLILPVLLAGLFLIGCDSSTNEDQVVELPLPREVAESDFTVTSSGLKYFDFVVGDTTFIPAEDSQQVVVHYNGWLEDGKMFDSSVYFIRNPIVFTLGVGAVIPGWDEGLLGMYPGGERQLVVPPQLAYDSTGRDGVPPNATLIFEVNYIGYLQ